MANDLEELRAQLQREQDLEDLRNQLRAESEQPIAPIASEAAPEPQIDAQPEVESQPMDEMAELRAQLLAEEQSKEEPKGLLESLYKGGKQGVEEDAARQAYTAWELSNNRIPDVKPMTPQKEWGWNREAIGENVGRAATSSIIPGLAAGAGGAGLGAAIGAPGGPLGAGFGAAAGTAAGFGSLSYIQGLADTYQEGRNKGWDHEKSLEEAAKIANIEGGGAALMGLFSRFGGNQLARGFFKKYLAKQIPTQVAISEAENTLRNIELKKSGLDPDREMFEGAGQAAVIPAATVIGAGLLHGRPGAKARAGVESDVTPKRGPALGEGPTEAPPVKPRGPINPEAPSGGDNIQQRKAIREFPKANEPVAEGHIIPHPEEAVAPFGIPPEPPAPVGKDRFVDTSKIVEINNTPHFYNEKTQSWEPTKNSAAGQEVPQKGIQKSEDVERGIEKAKQEIKPFKPAEKEVTGERVTPEVEKTRDKIFSKGSDNNPVKRSIMNKTAEWLTDSFYNIETQLFDAKTPLKVVGAIAQGSTPRQLRESANVPFRMASATEGGRLNGVVNAAYVHGTPVYNPALKIMELKPNSKGLESILDPAFQSTELAKAFELNRYGRRVHTQDLVEQGKELNLTPAEASMAVNLDAKYPQFKNMNQNLNNYLTAVGDFGVDTGLFNKEDRANWVGGGADYTPMYADMGVNGEYVKPKSSIVNQKSNIHELTGGSRQYLVRDAAGKPILRTESLKEARARSKQLGKGAVIENVGRLTRDLYENILNNVAYITQAGLRNAAAQSNIAAALKVGIAQPVGKASVEKRKRNGEQIVKVLQKGREKYYSISDPAYYNALMGVQGTPSEKLNKIQALGRNYKKFNSLALVADPARMAGIAVKDLIRTIVLGKDKLGAIGVLKSIGKNYINSFKHHYGNTLSPELIYIMASGNDTTFFGNIRAKDKADELKLKARKADGELFLPTAKDTLQDILKLYKNGIAKFGQASEQAHRLVLDEAAIKGGRNKAEAAFEAADSMDYSKRGASSTIRMLGNYANYFSTALQSIHKLLRELGHKRGKYSPIGWNNTVKNIAKVAAFVAGNAMINAIEDDDDETRANGFKTKTEDEKNLYEWLDNYKYLGFGSTSTGKIVADSLGLPRWFKILKAWEIGAIAMTYPSRIVNMFYEDNDYKNELKQMALVTIDNIHASPVPNAFRTFVESTTNYDFFKQGPIVPLNEQNLEPSEQYGEGTSGGAKKIGEALDWSPRKLDHAIKSIFGELGTFAAQAPDMFDGNPKEEKDFSETYFFNKFIGPEITRNNKLMNDLYERAHEGAVVTNTLKRYREQGEDDKADAYEEKNIHIIETKDSIEKYRDSVQDINKVVKETRADKDLSSTEKKQEIRNLMMARNDILRDMDELLQEQRLAIKEEKRQEAEEKRKKS